MSKKDCVNSEGWKNAQLKAKQTFKLIRAKNEELYYINPKKCACCDIVLSYDKRNSKFCSQRCNAIKANSGYNRHSGTSVLDRNCLNCGISLRGKACHAKCCCNACNSEYNAKLALHEWITEGMFKPKMLTAFGRIFYLNDRGMKCEECGWNKINPTTGKSPLNVEHIDGDCTNNIPENIKVLCPSCHSLTPTYGSLNKGKSKRIKRYKTKSE